MTTATNDMLAQSNVRTSTETSPLLSVISVLLGVNLRESLTSATTEQDDSAYAWGL
ncbi:MAG: hypothetical protein H7315_18305 [Herminiimonas sp.]|nr:hypothetical protein [Herminiimonas sp.]